MRGIVVIIFINLLHGGLPVYGQKNDINEVTSFLYDTTLAPFYHGIASGDPLNDRVIIWTRVTPMQNVTAIPVNWEISIFPAFNTVFMRGSAMALAEKDHTVKIDVTGLAPGTTYYYRFSALGKKSSIGRTKTLPMNTDRIKLAVVSCANWEAGFFNAYDKIADHNDIDAVVHLGDFIYEYGKSKQGEAIGRFHLPENEIVSLADYRTRYAQYRLDKGLLHMSSQHPLIAIWDDHEVANDSYTSGAQNHQPNEGDYEKRKAAARQAYYEWIPIREGEKHFRSFSFGNLADLILLDERLEGRTKPVDSLTDPGYLKEERSMLGATQHEWLERKLKTSAAKWKVIGNQVIFSDVLYSKTLRKTPRNLDSWDGFPAEKKRLTDFIQSNQINNIIFITGDSHASWAIEVIPYRSKTYNPITSEGAIAIEFGTTSVSSGNLDERFPVDQVKSMEAELIQLNPHVKYHNNRDHGYFLLTLYPEKAVGEWFFMESIRTQQTSEFLGSKTTVNSNTPRLKY